MGVSRIVRMCALGGAFLAGQVSVVLYLSATVGKPAAAQGISGTRVIDDLRVRRLSVVDDKGNEKGYLRVVNGNSIFVTDEAAASKLTIVTPKTFRPVGIWQGQDNGTVLTMLRASDHKVGIAVDSTDKDGSKIVFFRQDADNFGLYMGLIGGLPFVNLNDKSGTRRAAISVVADGTPVFGAFDKDGKPHAVMTGSDGPGFVGDIMGLPQTPPQAPQSGTQ